MQTPLHPLIVHLPIALAVLVPLFAVVVHLGLWRGWLRARAWAFVVAAQAILVGAGFLAMRSGEDDEDRVERVVAKSVIHEHEERAEIFVYAAAGVLGLALLALLLSKSRWGGWSRTLAMAGTLAVLGLGYRVGKSGGELIYVHGAASAFATPGTAPPQAMPAPKPQHDGEEGR